MICSGEPGREEELYNYVAVACCLVVPRYRGYLVNLTRRSVC